MMRDALKMSLASERDMKIIGEGGNGKEALKLLESLTPDVILMDLMKPEMNGVETIKQIFKSNPQARILVLTSMEDEECDDSNTGGRFRLFSQHRAAPISVGSHSQSGGWCALYASRNYQEVIRGVEENKDCAARRPADHDHCPSTRDHDVDGGRQNG